MSILLLLSCLMTQPFFLTESGAVVLTLRLEEAESLRFALDTGSTRTLLSARAARRLGLAASAAAPFVTPTSRSTVAVTTLGGLRLPFGATGPVRAGIVPSLRAGGHAVDGLLGQDVLRSLVYTIDYRRRLIEWGVPSRPPIGPRLPLVIGETSVLVTLAQGHDDRLLRMVPDSGAAGVVLFAKRRAELLDVTPGGTALLRTLSGARVVRRAVVEQLDVGDIILRDVQAVLAPEDSHHPALGDGLLPLHLFDRVTFDGPAGIMIVDGERRR